MPAAQPELRLALTNAFITPIDSEDIYVMFGRLDAVLNGAKGSVREAEVMGMEPDEAVAAMAMLLADGARQLAAAFERLDPDRRGSPSDGHGGSSSSSSNAASMSYPIGRATSGMARTTRATPLIGATAIRVPRISSAVAPASSAAPTVQW